MSISIDTSQKSTRAILWIIMILYMAILTKLIIFKRPLGYLKRHFAKLSHHYSWESTKANMNNGNLNLKPFATIKMYLTANMQAEYAINNLVGNIAGFIPLGILLPLLFSKLRSATATILVVLLMSFCFEIFQLLGMVGVCDVDDLILNTLGGAIGYCIFLLLKKIFTIQ